MRTKMITYIIMLEIFLGVLTGITLANVYFKPILKPVYIHEHTKMDIDH